MLVLVDTNTGRQLDFDPKKGFNVKVPGLGSFKVGKTGFELVFDNKLSINWGWDKDLDRTAVDAKVFLGDVGAVNFGYSKQMGEKFGLNLKHEGFDIKAEYAKNSIKFEGSYSWEGRRRPNPIQGVIGVGLDVNANNKTATFFFGIKY